MRSIHGISLGFLAGALLLLALACTSAPAAGPTPTPPSGGASPTPTPGMEKVRVLAPIDEVRINVAESFPPQYFVYVKSGLPNGCAEFDKYEVSREDELIRIAVYNLVPADPNIACTEEYRTVEHNIPLGSDFEPGKTYTVQVNDKAETFVAQGEATPTPTPVVEAGVGTEFRLGVGQTAIVMPADLKLTFVEVLEDSRCPINVTCVWEGQARIVLEAASDGRQPTRIEMTITGSGQGSTSAPINSYVVKLLALDPYPGTPEAQQQGDKPEYRATLMVNEVDGTATREEMAPIDDVKLLVEKSAPPRYTVEVVSGLPNGCAVFDRYEVNREGDTFTITVWNLMPADPNVVCTQIYGTVTHRIDLGTDFEPGKTYTLIVNRFSTTFVAEGGAQPPALGRPFEIKVGQQVIIESAGIAVELVDMVEDSRCPANVVCVQLGKAVVLVKVTKKDQTLGTHELVLEPPREDRATAQFGDYLVQFRDLQPYPGTTGGDIQKSDYVATLAVHRTPQPPPAGLTGGILATFEAAGETFKVWVTNPETIQQILDLQAGKSSASIPNGLIRRGPGAGDHNAPWSWHLDPQETSMAEVTIELCDGAPSFVEENLDYFVETVGRYCPWGASLVDVKDLR